MRDKDHASHSAAQPQGWRGKHGREELVAALAQAGHRVTYQSTEKKDYKKALKKSTDLVIVAGGDGTVTKIGCGLIDSGVPPSILPLGTANNLARSLGFAGPIGEVIRRLKRGKKHAFDVGLARGPWGRRYFLESVGGGVLADYLQRAKREDKKKLPKEQEMPRHVSLLRRMLHHYPMRRWKIDIDGKDISHRYILWEAMNIRSIGPGLHLAPPALTKVGYLDFVDAREEDRALLVE